MTRALGLALLLLAGACAQAPIAPAPEPPKKAAAPVVPEDALRQRAREQLATGQRQYEAGEYDAATKSLGAALDHGLLSKSEQARARKVLAFIHCLAGREGPCRDEFRKAFEIDSGFALTAAEDGHPIWGPVYRDVRTRLIAEREATEGRKAAFTPLVKSEQMLQDGMIKYDAGEFATSAKLLDAAFKEGLATRELQVRALKYLAFSLCLQDKWRACRATFVRIYDVDPDFDLTPAEAGHPSWTRTFAGAKAQAKRALAAKKAEEDRKRAKEEAATPGAPVTKKN